MSREFFPYNPLRLRLWLGGGCLVGLALTAWAVVGFLDSQAPREILRAGLSFGLAAALGVGFYRFRPRDQWGVRVTALSVLVSRPRQGIIEVPWGAVKELRRLGDKRDILALWLKEEGRILVPAHLFARREDFEALASAIEERMPPPRYDA
jgi:hypothetical protein